MNSLQSRLKKVSALYEEYLSLNDHDGLVIVLPNPDGTFQPMVYHDINTGEEVPGLADGIRACEGMGELQELLAGYRNNLPKRMLQ